MMTKLLNRLDQNSSVRQKIECLQMKIQILRPRCSNADRMHPGIPEAEQIVEHDRMKRSAELKKLGGGTVQVPSLVRRADDEDTHVLTLSSVKSGIIVLADVIPVNIEIVEGPGVTGSDDQFRWAMGRKTHMSHATI